MKRRHASWITGSCAGLLFAAGAWAQQGQPPTLPPDIVTPAPASPTQDDAPSDETFDGLEDPLFPGLADQEFAGADSITRGGKSLFDAPNFGTIIDREQIEERQASDMYRALQNEVGILMQSTGRGQASPFIRSLTGQQILILVDGIRLNNSTYRSGPNQYFNLVDPGQVERIEVLRGSQSAAWGSDAIGGAINIVTRSADFDRGAYRGGSFTEIFGSADSSSYSRMNVEGASGYGGLFAGGSYLNVRDVQTAGPLGRQPFTNYSQYAGDVKYDYLLDEDQMLTFALQHFEQESVPRSDRFPPFVLGPPTNSPRPTFFGPQQRDLAYIRWQGVAYNSLFDGWTSTVSYQRNKEGLFEQRSATQIETGEFDVDTLGYTLALAKDIGVAGKLTYGVDYYYDDIDAEKVRYNPQSPATPPSIRVPQYPDDARYERLGVFLNWDVWLTQRLALSTGLRYENIDASATPTITINNVDTPVAFDRTFSDWIASAGLTYELTDEWRLVGGVYEGFRAPNIDDLTSTKTYLQNAQAAPTLATLDVQPEHAYTYEVGVKYDGPRFRLQLFEYWIDFQDSIGRVTDGAGNALLANNDAYLNGTEASGEYLLTDEWSLYGNFMYNYGFNIDLNEPYSRTAPTQGILGLRWRDICRRSYFDVYTWMVRRQDRYAVLNLTDSRFPVGGTPGYATLNLRAGHTFGDCDQHHVSLGLENITDKAYRVLGSGVDGTGFNAILGYTYTR